MPQGQCKSARNWMRRDETRKRTDAEWLLERKKVCERKLGGVCVWETGCGGLLTLPPTSWLATSPRPHTCLNPSSSSLCSLVDWPLLLPWSICPWLCTPQSGLDLQPATFTHTPFAFCDFRGAFLKPPAPQAFLFLHVSWRELLKSAPQPAFTVQLHCGLMLLFSLLCNTSCSGFLSFLLQTPVC